MARGLASLGLEFSAEAVEPVTGYRVDMLLHGGDCGAAGRCAVEVSIGMCVVCVSVCLCLCVCVSVCVCVYIYIYIYIGMPTPRP